MQDAFARWRDDSVFHFAAAYPDQPGLESHDREQQGLDDRDELGMTGDRLAVGLPVFVDPFSDLCR